MSTVYVAAGREVVVPRPDCPGCRQPMRFWGWYERDVRVSAEVIHRLSVRRARCCERTHALLPGFVTWGRLDAVEVIGSALETMCGGVGMRRVAERLGLAHTTVRDWRRRFARRAELLAVGFSRFCVAVGDLAPRLSGRPETVAVAAARAAWVGGPATVRRWSRRAVAAGQRRGRRTSAVAQHGSALGSGVRLPLDAHRRLPTVGEASEGAIRWTTTAMTGPSRSRCSASA